MKALWRRVFLVVFLLAGIAGSSFAESMTRKEALVFAESSQEAKAVYGLKGGKFVNCINKSVMKPCETDWVTCIDDAWVVKFEVSQSCGVSHDGRVDLVLLVDAVNRKIISRYPEKEYYLEPLYCQMDDDCLMLEDETCYNFVYGQVSDKGRVKGHCACSRNNCTVKND